MKLWTRKTIKVMLFVALCLGYIFAVRALGDYGGVSVALFGFIGKAISSVAKIAGKVIGVGSSSTKPITITTTTDPTLKAAVESNAAALKALADQQSDKIFGMPKMVVYVGGALIVAGAVYFLIIRRRK